MLITKKQLIDIMFSFYCNSSVGVSEDFFEMLEIADSYDGYLDGERYYEMDLFDEFFCNYSPTDLLYSIDGDNFNIRDAYFKDTVWGIQSCDEKDYDLLIDRDFMETIIDTYIDEISSYSCYEFDTFTMIEFVELFKKYSNSDDTADIDDDEITDDIKDFIKRFSKDTDIKAA